MNPNYFYDLGYVSPLGAQMYEYSKHDPDNKVDFATFYHDDMWTKGLLTDESRSLIEQYQQAPNDGHQRNTLGLEFDCSSVKPALFLKFHFHKAQLNEEILNGVASIIGLPSIPHPTLPFGVRADDVGIYPERGLSTVRFLVRGNLRDLKQFAIDNGAEHADRIPDVLQRATLWNTGINFDWDGSTMSNFTFYSEALMIDDPWVQESRQHCLDHIAPLFEDGTYHLSQFVKIGLSDNYQPDYLKAYFTVRVKWS
jgi:hypothetical protein